MALQDKPRIPFNVPYMTGKEMDYISQAHANGKLAGDGPFTKKCHQWLEEETTSPKALLTHSCTAALEMFALLLDIEPGDEVIMPSYTFVSTANAFALRGAVPVFIDIRPDTMNMNEALIEAAITPKTKAIVPVHYAGVSCEMDTILAIAHHHNIPVAEDSAQGLMASYKGRPLGSLGAMGALSFHETKNLISGEGGALLINDPALVDRAEIIREKGTNRSQFFRGIVDKYTWHEIGSSFLPGELTAAFLYAQFEDAQSITNNRLSSWRRYNEILEPLESEGILARPHVPETCTHNAHMFYIILAEHISRADVIARLSEAGINSVFHYIPLHSAPAGRKYARAHGDLSVTNTMSERLLRLPLWHGMDSEVQNAVAQVLSEFSG